MLLVSDPPSPSAIEIEIRLITSLAGSFELKAIERNRRCTIATDAWLLNVNRKSSAPPSDSATPMIRP